MILKILIATAVIVLIVIMFDSRMIVRRYEIDSPKVDTPIRIALITDLHSCKYGKKQTKLLDAIYAESPDLVLLGGDIFDDVIEDTNTELFLAGISERYPCYYVTGNHEYWSGQAKFSAKIDILNKYNIVILAGTSEVVEVNGESINLCGVNDPDAYMVEIDSETDPQAYVEAQNRKEVTFTQQLDNVSSVSENGYFTLLLSHRPEFFEQYTDYNFDLVLSGHAHGGQWRVPLVLNGLYAPDQGVFPEYAGGRYEQDGTTMIVSRGLARESTWAPRVFNRPELVIVDIT